MADRTEPVALLRRARVDPKVFELRPDYRALLLVATGLSAGPSSPATERMLVAAEDHARALLAERPVEELGHIAAWRAAYRSFGAKPQRTRNSLEALTRRATTGLPRVNALTDLYNAVSVLHQVPIGGEDLARYEGSPALVRAGGAEAFDTTDHGEPAVEHPESGEVVWCDGSGVTCRRWNWRQGVRTRLVEGTATALFILDALDPCTDGELTAAAEDLDAQLRMLGESVTITSRTIAKETP